MTSKIMKYFAQTILAFSTFLFVSCHEGSPRAGGVLDETESTVAGTLVDANNHKVPLARVSLHPVPKSNILPSTLTLQSDTTDSLGRFRFKDVAQGLYYVEANSGDTIGAIGHATVNSSDSVSVNISAQRVSWLNGQLDSTLTDTLYCPQLGLRIAVVKGQLPGTLLLPPGNLQLWTVRNDTLLKSAWPLGVDSLAVLPSSNISLTPTQIMENPHQDTIVIQPGPSQSKDTYITFAFSSTDSSISLGTVGNMNAGAKPCYGCGPYDFNTDSRILIAFTLPDSITVVDTVISATMTFSNNTWISKGLAQTYPLEVHKLLKDWKQGSGYAVCGGLPVDANSSTINGATAKDRWWTADSSARWSQLGIGLKDDDASSAVYATTYVPSASILPVHFDITALVSEWVSTPSSNFGMLIRNPNEFSGTFVDYPMLYSGEYTDSTQRPALTIVFRAKS